MSTIRLSHNHYASIRMMMRSINENPSLKNEYLYPIIRWSKDRGIDTEIAIDRIIDFMFVANDRAYCIDYCQKYEHEEFDRTASSEVISMTGLFKAMQSWRYNTIYTFESLELDPWQNDDEKQMVTVIQETMQRICEKIITLTEEYKVAKWSI